VRRSCLTGLVAGFLLAGALAATAAGSTSVVTDVSSNWAGYVASSPVVAFGGASASFSAASGTWVQPAGRCGPAETSGRPTAAAFWVGLGGNSQSSTALEQLGTEADCTAAGTASYFAWYELVPAASRTIHLVVRPGDRISASVAVSGNSVTVRLRDSTRGTSFSRVLRMAAPDTSSAEWIAEAPSICSSANTCRLTALTDFDTVGFSQASATSDGHTGTISDPDWTTTALQLEDGGGGFGRYGAESSPAQATPGALRSAGAGFTVSWARGQSPGGFGGGGFGGGFGGGGDGSGSGGGPGPSAL
jgi:hypothetical protein